MSDQGSPLKNELLLVVITELRSKHNFTTAYSTWANDTVESSYCEAIRACNAIRSEWKLCAQDLSAVIPTIQSVLKRARLL